MITSPGPLVTGETLANPPAAGTFTGSASATFTVALSGGSPNTTFAGGYDATVSIAGAIVAPPPTQSTPIVFSGTYDGAGNWNNSFTLSGSGTFFNQYATVSAHFDLQAPGTGSADAANVLTIIGPAVMPVTPPPGPPNGN